MSVQENKAVIRRWIEARNANDVETAVAQWTDDRQESIRAAFDRFTEGFSGIQIAMQELVAEGDKVAIWWTFHGTHIGAFADVPATGKAVEYGGVDLYTVVNGKIASLRREGANLRDILLASS
jgi:predicted ester cyclase